MNETNLNENKSKKSSDFWFWFFFLILPIIGVVVELIAFKLEKPLLMVLALLMLMSFPISIGVLIYQGVKASKEMAAEAIEEEPDPYYETYLNIDEKEILKSKKNPYKKAAIKSLVIIALSIFVPLIIAELLRESDAMLFGFYLKNIFKALPILLGFVSMAEGWKNIALFFEFKRAKKIAISKKNEEKKPFLLPRFNLLSLLFLLLAVVVMSGVCQDAAKLNDYKKNGVAVDAVSYDVEKDGEDNYVHFKYTYNGEEYSYVSRNYPGGTKIGNEVVGYIYPDNPEELFLFYSSSFAVYIMLLFALFFLWMENNWKKSILALCLLILGCFSMGLGFIEGATSHKVWGVIFLLCSLYTWSRCIKKTSK